MNVYKRKLTFKSAVFDMDVWIIINPILKVLLYAASFVSVGTPYLVFMPNTSHWREAYCDNLTFKLL